MRKKILIAFFALVFVSGCIAFLSPGIATGVFFVTLICYFAFKKPEYLLLCLIAYLPFEPFLLKFVADDMYVYVRYFSESIVYLLFIALVGKKIYQSFVGESGRMNQEAWSYKDELGIRKQESGFLKPMIRDSYFMIQSRWLYIAIGILFFISFFSLLINWIPLDVGILGVRQIFRFLLLLFVVLLLEKRLFINADTNKQVSEKLFINAKVSGTNFPLENLRKVSDTNKQLDMIQNTFQKAFFVIIFSIILIQSILGITQVLSGGRIDEFLVPSERKIIGSLQLTTGTNKFWEEGRRVFGTMGRYDQLGSFLTISLLMLIAFLYEFKDESRIMKHESWSYKDEAGSTTVDGGASESSFFHSIIHDSIFMIHHYFQKQKVILSCIVLLGITTLILTYSRASWFAFLAGLVVVGIFLKRDKKLLGGFALALTLGVILFFASGKVNQYIIDSPNQTLIERAFEVFSPSRWMGEYYGLGRMYFIVNTPPNLISYAPLFGLFGVGPGTFGGGAVAALHYTKEYGVLHLPFGIWGSEGHIDNNWFSLMGEIGFLGLCVYWCIFLLLGYYSYQLYTRGHNPFTRSLGLGYAGVLVAVFVLGFFAMYLEMRTLAPYFWILGGLVVINYQLSIKN